MFIFFFQAEDGIRDYKVTGVQTCALPICAPRRPAAVTHAGAALVGRSEPQELPALPRLLGTALRRMPQLSRAGSPGGPAGGHALPPLQRIFRDRLERAGPRRGLRRGTATAREY